MKPVSVSTTVLLTPEEVDRAAGRLDGLVNAAGIAHLGTVEDTSFAIWRRIMAVNLDGTFLGCKHAMPLLRRRGGGIGHPRPQEKAGKKEMGGETRREPLEQQATRARRRLGDRRAGGRA